MELIITAYLIVAAIITSGLFAFMIRGYSPDDGLLLFVVYMAGAAFFGLVWPFTVIYSLVKSNQQQGE